MTPAISVVVPCRNEAEALARCLDALARQDYPRAGFEVIVVDGGSTDGSAALAAAWGARVLPDAGKGPAAARNIGIHAARGGVVAFTDSDCVPRSDWLTRVAEVFAEDPGVVGVAGALRMPRDTFLGRMEDDEARAFYRGVITSNVAYSRDALLGVGGFDESLLCAEDWDLAWRLMDAGSRVVHDPRPVVVHAPPETRGSLARYLHKQYWYARTDVPAQVRAIRRSRASRAAGSGGALSGALDAVANAALCAGVGAGLAARSPRMVAACLGAALAAGAARASRAARYVDGPAELPARTLVMGARRLVRGAGTLAGCARLLTPRGLRLVNAPARAPLLPPARGAPRAAPSAPAPA